MRDGGRISPNLASAMPPSGYNKQILNFSQIKKKKVRAQKKALGAAKIHAKVRVANVSGVRTKKHQRKADHKERMLAAAAALDDGAAVAQPPAVVDEDMEDAPKVQKREKAKVAKKERKASKMKE